MRSRSMTSTLSGALVAAVVAMSAAVAVAPAAEAAGPDRLPFTITNSSGRSEAVYVYVLGTDLSTGGLGYVDAGGTFTAWPAGGNPPTAAPDVAIAGPSNGSSTTISLPRGISGRVYFSLGEKLAFFLTPGGLVQPAPWSPDDPNKDVLFDWSELTYNDSGLWLNSSQVDMLAVPHAVTVTGASGTKTSGELVANGRDRAIDAIAAQPGWADTVVRRTDGTVLRVLAPGKAAGAGLLSTTYLDPYIASAWSAYATRPLTVVPFADRPGTRYFGRTTGTVMTFTDASGGQVASFERPTSADVWGCDGALLAPNDLVVGPIARTLCAALNRGTLGTVDTEPSTDASAFYASSPANQYGRLVHESMADGKAYAFAFDDVGNFESLVNEGSPSAAGLVIQPFTGGADAGGTRAATGAPSRS
ncbi:beta-1,3-glucanase family protein [Cellulomonas sp. URHB0016]